MKSSKERVHKWVARKSGNIIGSGKDPLRLFVRMDVRKDRNFITYDPVNKDGKIFWYDEIPRNSMLRAMVEVDREIKSGKMKGYEDIDQLFKDLGC